MQSVLSIVHDINSWFDCDPTHDVTGIFLGISKAFDKVWQEGLLLKLKTYGVKGEIFFEIIFMSAIKDSFVMVRSLLGSW